MPSRTVSTKSSLDSWSDTKVAPPAASTGKTTVAFTLVTSEDTLEGGEMKGRTVSSVSIAHLSDQTEDGPFSGIQVFEGWILERKGTFTANICGTFVGGMIDLKLDIIEGSGTGQLKGIHGTASYTVNKDRFFDIPVQYNLHWGDDAHAEPL